MSLENPWEDYEPVPPTPKWAWVVLVALLVVAAVLLRRAA